RAADLAAREDFYEVGAGGPRFDDFGGCQRSGHDQLCFADSKLDGGAVEARTDEKLSAGVETAACVGGIQHRSRADENFGAGAFCELANDVDSAGTGHGDFHDGDATLADGLGGDVRFALGRCADHGDDSDFFDATANVLFIHFRFLA